MISRPSVSLPSSEQQLLVLSWLLGLAAFLLLLFLYIANPLLPPPKRRPVEMAHRAMHVLRVLIVLGFALTFPLLYINFMLPSAVSDPITSFKDISAFRNAPAGSGSLQGVSKSSSDGRQSWNFSVARPLFSLMGMTFGLAAGDDHVARVVACLCLWLSVACDALASLDVSIAINTLRAKCSVVADRDACLGDRTAGDAEEQVFRWSVSKLTWLFRREVVASSLELTALLVVCFMGVTLGFRSNTFGGLNVVGGQQRQRLWKELRKLGITTWPPASGPERLTPGTLKDRRSSPISQRNLSN